jgi:hypothetical protein
MNPPPGESLRHALDRSPEPFSSHVRSLILGRKKQSRWLILAIFISCANRCRPAARPDVFFLLHLDGILSKITPFEGGSKLAPFEGV